MLPADRKGRRIVKILRPFFVRSSNTSFILNNIFFFVFWIKFRKTKQTVVTLVATTLKSLFSIAKTNGRFSGREFYTNNINNLFWNILAHISPINIQKVRQPKSAHKNANSGRRQTNHIQIGYITILLLHGICILSNSSQ